MILFIIVNDIQEKITQLQNNRWTVTALAERLGQARVTVDKWKSGEHYPANAKAVLVMLEQMTKEKRVPKQRRYVKGNRIRDKQAREGNGGLV